MFLCSRKSLIIETKIKVLEYHCELECHNIKLLITKKITISLLTMENV